MQRDVFRFLYKEGVTIREICPRRQFVYREALYFHCQCTRSGDKVWRTSLAQDKSVVSQSGSIALRLPRVWFSKENLGRRPIIKKKIKIWFS
ncbi:hypothetical protein AVEN_1471-1 [Araneus ventricosus]|uniref:Uncharacterized protein n=1 Tax=Araneus ventricosus TaxID=182803 RepID=A0A4Y2HDY7_ARAVE|nr:hypothetical protein AVEN_1471-1 [Araneus ventricosus]